MDIEAYILIGGRSSRLGTDKAFAEIGGMTLAERAVQTVRGSNIATKTTLVAGSETQFAVQAIALDAPFIFDLAEGGGPPGGLHAALSYAESEWIFLFACDFPLVSPDFIGLLANKISDDFGSIVPVQPDGRLQPLCAFYNVWVARPLVDEIINTPRVSPPMREIVNALNPRLVMPDEYEHLVGSELFFSNLNTPGDLRDIRNMK